MIEIPVAKTSIFVNAGQMPFALCDHLGSPFSSYAYTPIYLLFYLLLTPDMIPDRFLIIGLYFKRFVHTSSPHPVSHVRIAANSIAFLASTLCTCQKQELYAYWSVTDA